MMVAGKGTAICSISPLRRWCARLTLLVLACTPIWALLPIHLKHHHRVWPFGPTYSLGIGLGTLMIAAAIILIGFIVAVTAVIVTCVTLNITMKWLWAEAFSDYNLTWRSRWQAAWAFDSEPQSTVRSHG